MRKFTADFETTTNQSNCHVWAYAICEIGKYVINRLFNFL